MPELSDLYFEWNKQPLWFHLDLSERAASAAALVTVSSAAPTHSLRAGGTGARWMCSDM